MSIAKICFLLVILTLGAFANILGNGFVGDDNAIIVGNDFYRSGKIEQVFSKAYISTGNNMWLSKAGNRGSGSVAYRPVTSLTYFMDYFLWHELPMGYHATSIFLHLINVLLVFLVLRAMRAPDFAAFAGACLFAVHPLQSEPVAAISYRSDLLVTMFLLLATFAWIRFRAGRSYAWFVLAVTTFGLALFSKETAVFWVLWCLFHDRSRGFAWRAILGPAAILAFLTGVYLWLYFGIFRNTTLEGGGVFASFSWVWLGSMAEVWGTYVLFLLAPWTVVPLPGTYTPQGMLWWTSVWFWLVVAFLTGVAAWWRWASLEERLLLGWALLFFIPVSGVIANPNTAACRYLYLPLVGIAGALVVFLNRRFPQGAGTIGRALMLGYMAAAIVFTVIDNGYWKNNYMIGSIWVEKFPDFYKGHVILGVELIHRGRVLESIPHFERALRDPRCLDPLAWHGLAYAYAFTGRSVEANNVSAELERIFPWYTPEVSHP